MKEYLLPSIMLTLLAASCGHSRDKATVSQSDSDSTFIEEPGLQADSIVAELPALTADSLGPVRIGMTIAGLKAGIPGLYDRIVADNSSEGGAHVYSFYLGSEYMFDVFDFGNGRVDVISLQSKRLGVETPDGLLTMGMPMKKLLAQKGYTTEFLSLDDEGVWYWRYRGLWFSPALGAIDQALDQALSNRNAPPSAALAGDNPIGYIATGSPF